MVSLRSSTTYGKVIMVIRTISQLQIYLQEGKGSCKLFLLQEF